jgi:L-alanine-DL-glutamate epimerase-like enolase superfamily enzyme
MKITRLEAWPVTMELAEPYSIAGETFASAANVFIRIETDSSMTGFGCAAPEKSITGETPESVMQVLNNVAAPLLTNLNPLEPRQVIDKCAAELGTQHAALAAVDMALYDILGKNSDAPLFKLFGSSRTSFMTSITIGILPVDETIDRAMDWLAQGFKCLKIKGGKTLEADIEKINKLREKIGPEVSLRFDANQGYTIEDTLKFIEATKQANLEFIEQPTPKDKSSMLGRIRAESSIPIMADESLVTFKDTVLLTGRDLIDSINIKLMKVGGSSKAASINAVAEANSHQVMVGCMDEAALAIAAGLHFALSHPNVVYCDLDGHIGLKGDPSDGAVILKDGHLFPTDRPGLGFDL